MNYRGVAAIYRFEISRAIRTVSQSIASPIISTVLYFIVFGAAIGSRMQDIDGVSYSSFIIPGLVMMAVLGQGVSSASFGIYFPRFAGTVYEILSAPLSAVEIVLGYVGAAATRSLFIGVTVLLTSWLFVPIEVAHPFWMVAFLILTCVAFSMLGFIVGVWADGFEKLQIIPLLIITPLTFLGGGFYSITMLPPFWRKASLLNPVVYLVSGFRWSFYGSSDISPHISLIMIFVFFVVCSALIAYIFKTGYRLKS